MKTIKEAWSFFYKEHEDILLDVYPGLNLDIFLRDLADILIKFTSNPIIQLDHAACSVSQSIEMELQEQFLKGTPLGVLMGFSEFYYHRFFIDQHVLVPRPETEYMVDLLVQEYKGKVQKVLDVGTGSGVILLSLVYHGVGKSGVGVDISPEALRVAKINLHRLRLENKVTLLKSDRLRQVEGTFDLIVSNPPYIKASSHRKLVHNSVDKHEPHQALYLPDDYYGLWFEDFFQEVRSHLNGTFMMEGHELELDEQAKMLGRLGFQDIKVMFDMTGIKRYVKARFNQ